MAYLVQSNRHAIKYRHKVISFKVTFMPPTPLSRVSDALLGMILTPRHVSRHVQVLSDLYKVTESAVDLKNLVVDLAHGALNIVTDTECCQKSAQFSVVR